MQASTAKVEAGGISRIKKLLEPVERLEGGIVKGFQRGRELGWPTANLNPRAFEGLTLEQGVYFGWARISSEDVVYMAMISIGNNPTFDNPTKSLVHASQISKVLVRFLMFFFFL